MQAIAAASGKTDPRARALASCRVGHRRRQGGRRGGGQDPGGPSLRRKQRPAASRADCRPTRFVRPIARTWPAKDLRAKAFELIRPAASGGAAGQAGRGPGRSPGAARAGRPDSRALLAPGSAELQRPDGAVREGDADQGLRTKLEQQLVGYGALALAQLLGLPERGLRRRARRLRFTVCRGMAVASGPSRRYGASAAAGRHGEPPRPVTTMRAWRPACRPAVVGEVSRPAGVAGDQAVQASIGSRTWCCWPPPFP